MRELRNRRELAFEYALILNHCGMLCKYLRRFKAAHACYQRALMFQESHAPTNAKSIADIYYNLAGLEHAANPSGKKRCGVVYARKALRKRIRLFGWAHPDTALAASMVAANLIVDKSYRRAETYAQRAIMIQYELFGDTHRDIAMNLNHLGTIRYASADYQSARDFFERAYEIKVATVGDEHPDLLVILYNLLRTKRKLGDTSNNATLEAQLARLCEAHPPLVIGQFRELLAKKPAALDG
jgi:tetratricopeptide (TPR) repeat protein